MAKKSWIEKFANPSKGIIKRTPKGVMYISYPKEIFEVLKIMPARKLVTTKEIAQFLAKKHKADYTCGMTTGIFLSVVANYIEKMKELGENISVPYWRVVRTKGRLYPKYLGTVLPQKEYLEKEGFTIVPSGNKKEPWAVKNWEKYLYRLNFS